MSNDKVRLSIDQAHELLERAAKAQKTLSTFSQEKVDAIVEAMARAALDESYRLGQMAHLETGYGTPADKAVKNRFSAQEVYNFIRPMRTVGIIRETESVLEVASPRGIIAGIIPSTNPTSTAIFKILISIKARDAIVLSPHPAAINCINETARVMREAAVAAGLPPDAIGCMTESTIEGTQELMRHSLTALILATGGMGLVRAAYSSGKPAFGVGPGNVPALIERTANVTKAVRDILTGKCFDNGTICSSEQAIVVERAIEPQVRQKLIEEGAYFLSRDQQEKLQRVAITPEGKLNPQIVGKSARMIAEWAGIQLPEGARAMVCQLEGVGPDFPLSMEKLSPILAYYVVEDFEEGCQISAQILAYGGMGHTAAIHTQSRQAAREYGLRMPASRIIVNSPSTHGAIGFTTDLEPSMTLGCGSWGGNVTSDNISPRHLLDIKRIAFETRPVNKVALEEPKTAAPVDREAIAALVDRFLRERHARIHRERPPIEQHQAQAQNGRIYDFVCEEDVKRAIAAREKIYINSKTIITPAARDLGEAHEIFVRT